jgi:hypothetical protein
MPEPAHDPVEPDLLPVPSSVPEARPVESSPRGEITRFLGSLPAPAVAAAGGFVMGVITWVAVRVLRRGRSRSGLPGRGRRGRRGVEVAATRSFLVDVHLLKDR